MRKCREPGVGALLHAYELHGLSDEDKRRFELHMMSCESCFTEVKNFRKTADSLITDPRVREIVEEGARGDEKARPSISRKYLTYLWPKVPLVFRPALLYIVLILMAFPAYWGLKSQGFNRIRTVQTITLFPDRSTGKEVFEIGAGGEGQMSFLFRDAVPGETYALVIRTNDGEVIFSDPSFHRFDEYGTGHLLLPLSEMKPGVYRLTITDPRAKPEPNTQEYRFRIEE